jgi:hypothetical protein
MGQIVAQTEFFSQGGTYRLAMPRRHTAQRYARRDEPAHAPRRWRIQPSAVHCAEPVGGCAARITPHRPAGDHRRRRGAPTPSAERTIRELDLPSPHQLLAPATSLTARRERREELPPLPRHSLTASGDVGVRVRPLALAPSVQFNPVGGRGWAADQIPAARTWSRRWIGVADQIYARDLAVGRWSAW